MSGKNFAIFSAQYPPHMGGVEVFTQNLARELSARGNHVTVVANDTEGVGAGKTDEDGVEVFRMPCWPLMNGRMPLPKHGRATRALRRELFSRKWDGVLVNTRFYLHSLLGMKLAMNSRLVPVVLDHGSAHLSVTSPVVDAAIHCYEHAITAYGKLQYAPDYYGISKMSSTWLEHFGITSSGEINNSIDADAYVGRASSRNFRAELGLENRFVIAFTGRLIPEKGIDAIIEASSDPRLQEREVVFLLAGDGPLMPKAKDAEGDYLHALGRLDSTDVASLLLQSDALCLPTRSEGFSTTLLEAAACGCPAIMTNVGGARELIPTGEYGTIIPDMSADSIIEAVAALTDNRALLERQGANCARWVRETCSWSTTADALEKAWRKADLRC